MRKWDEIKAVFRINLSTGSDREFHHIERESRRSHESDDVLGYQRRHDYFALALGPVLVRDYDLVLDYQDKPHKGPE